MRLLPLAATLALVACKPDPIEACVEAEKNADLLRFCRDCSSNEKKETAIALEPLWRKKCMRQAAGRDD